VSAVELILPQLADLTEEVLDTRRRVMNVEALIKRLLDPKPQWELMPDAIKNRRAGRRTLLAAINDGRVKCERRHRRGPEAAYYLSTEDLDQHFPMAGKA
jgi:hypothetical protein